jgi:hypothetical protein
MYPHTRKLIDMLGGPEPAEEVPDMEPAVHEDDMDPKILQLRLKKKYQLGMIKKMLEEGGYGDLAKMTTIGRKAYDIEE